MVSGVRQNPWKRVQTPKVKWKWSPNTLSGPTPTKTSRPRYCTGSATPATPATGSHGLLFVRVGDEPKWRRIFIPLEYIIVHHGRNDSPGEQLWPWHSDLSFFTFFLLHFLESRSIYYIVSYMRWFYTGMQEFCLELYLAWIFEMHSSF